VTIRAFDTPRYTFLIVFSCVRAFLFGRSMFQSKLFFSALFPRNCDVSSKFATFLFRLFIFLRFTFLISCTCVGNTYPKSSLRLRLDSIARCYRMYSHFGRRRFQRLHWRQSFKIEFERCDFIGSILRYRSIKRDSWSSWSPIVPFGGRRDGRKNSLVLFLLSESFA